MKKKTDILFINPMSYSNLAEYDRNILSNLPKDTIQMHYAHSTLLDLSIFKARNILFYEVFNYNKKKTLIKGLLYLKSLFKVLQIIFYQKIDIIHIQWLKLYYIDYVFLVFVKYLRPKIKLIYTCHNVLPHNSGYQFTNIFKTLYPLFDEIIVHEKNAKNQLKNSFNINPSKIHIIPHGLLELKLDSTLIQKNVEDLIEKKKINIVIPGLISKYKGIETIINCWDKFKELESFENINVIIAGQNNYGPLDILYTYRNIKVFENFLTNSEFHYLITNSDIILLPYTKISQSGVLMTVLHYHKNVIVSNIGGLTDPFEFTNIGWIIDVNQQILSLKNYLDILQTTKKHDLTKSFNTNWQIIDKKYSWKEIALSTHQIYIK